MLYDAEHIRAVVNGLKRNFTDKGKPIPPLVVDPVSVSTSGHRLLNEQAECVMIGELFPLATLITPNKAEADVLNEYYEPVGRDKIESLESAIMAARSLSSKAGCSALLKGGHLNFKRL